MATLVTKTVKTSGGDYTSLSGWEAGQQANIVTADQIQRAELYSMSDTTALVIDGWTTDATRYIELVVATGERHDGKWNTSKYRYESTATVGMDLVEDYIRLDGLQISHATTNNNFRGVLFRNGGEYQCQNCIIKGIYTATAAGRFVSNGATGTLKIWNCIIYDGVCSTNGIEGLLNQSTGTLYAFNITLQNCRTGFRRNSGTFVAINSSAQDCNDGWSGTFDAASTNNCSDIASDAPATNAQTGTIVYVDKANDDFHLDASDTVAKDHGTDLSAHATIPFSIDIDGATRSGTWDIGADEITAGASITATLSVTDDPDTLSSSALVSILGANSVTDAADTVSSSGAIGVVGAVTVTDASDSVSGACTATGNASVSRTDDDDTCTSTATVSVVGTESTTDVADAISGNAVAGVVATLSVTDDTDTLSSFASSLPLITAILSVTDESDSLSALGIVRSASAQNYFAFVRTSRTTSANPSSRSRATKSPSRSTARTL